MTASVRPSGLINNCTQNEGKSEKSRNYGKNAIANRLPSCDSATKAKKPCQEKEASQHNGKANCIKDGIIADELVCEGLDYNLNEKKKQY